MKPSGWSILQVPLDDQRKHTFEDDSITDPLERERLFGKDDHVRVYGQDYQERLFTAGFSVKVDDFAQEFSEAEIHQFGLPKGE